MKINWTLNPASLILAAFVIATGGIGFFKLNSYLSEKYENKITDLENKIQEKEKEILKARDKIKTLDKTILVKQNEIKNLKKGDKPLIEYVDLSECRSAIESARQQAYLQSLIVKDQDEKILNYETIIATMSDKGSLTREIFQVKNRKENMTLLAINTVSILAGSVGGVFLGVGLAKNSQVLIYTGSILFGAGALTFATGNGIVLVKKVF